MKLAALLLAVAALSGCVLAEPPCCEHYENSGYWHPYYHYYYYHDYNDYYHGGF